MNEPERANTHHSELHKGGGAGGGAPVKRAPANKSSPVNSSQTPAVPQPGIGSLTPVNMAQGGVHPQRWNFQQNWHPSNSTSYMNPPQPLMAIAGPSQPQLQQTGPPSQPGNHEPAPHHMLRGSNEPAPMHMMRGSNDPMWPGQFVPSPSNQVENVPQRSQQNLPPGNFDFPDHVFISDHAMIPILTQIQAS